jgi:predicted ArsR family transcriptional regulator
MHPTRRAILDVLKRCSSASLKELASDLGLVPVTVRAHVQALESTALVASSDVRGQRGRPYRVYTLTLKAEEQFFPKQYDDLALQLLSGVAQIEGKEALQLLVDRVAENMAAAQRPRVEGKPIEQRVAEVTRIFEETGGAAELTETEEGYVVQEYNCPYLRVSRQSAHVCEIDRRRVSKLVGAPVELSPSRLRDGAPSCAFIIPVRDPSLS